METQITLPCLGRPLQLGMLYDCRMDQPVPGITLWKSETLCGKRVVQKKERSQVDFLIEETLSDKWKKMDIHGEMKLSVLAGLVTVEGAGKYIGNKKSSENISRVVFKYSCRSYFLSLTMDLLNRTGIEYEDAFTNDMATHVVTAIEYGAEAIFVFDYQLGKSEDGKVITGALKGIFNKIPIVAVEGNVGIQLDKGEESLTNHLKCTFHGDVFLEKPPTTFTEAVSVMKSLPSLIRCTVDKDGIYGVPQIAYLYPLHKLDNRASQLLRSISVGVITDTSDILEQVEMLVVRLEDLLQDSVYGTVPSLTDQFLICIRLISKFLASFKQELATILPAVRGSSANDEEIKLMTRIMSVKKSPFDAVSLKAWIDAKEQEMQFFKQYIHQLITFPFLIKPGDLEQHTLDTSVKYVAGISLAAFCTEKDEYLRAMENFSITDDESCPVDVESLMEGHWINDNNITEGLRRKVKHFIEFAKENESRKDVKFVVVFYEKVQRALGAIVLYSESQSSLFQPPTAPGAPTMLSNGENSITISWTKPENGEKCITGYIVSYKLDGGSLSTAAQNSSFDNGISQWRTVETKSLETHCTIDRLHPNSNYVFKVSAVCAVGISKSSEDSQPLTTLTPPSYASTILNTCSIIPTEGSQLTWYQLPLKVTYEVPQKLLQEVSVGEPHFEDKGQKVLLIVGATGSGKSTLINGMINYLFGVKCTDRFRLVLISVESEMSQAFSQTSFITAYTIHWQPGMCFPYSLTIIDSPGYGDSRGIQRDMEITKQIKEFFEMQNGEALDELDGIGFVCQSSLARLTDSQKYIFDSILSIFGKDVAENIFLMLTFADASPPPVLDAIRAHQIPFKAHFKLNSSVFAFNNGANRQESTKSNSNQEKFDHMFWELAETTFNDFFSELQCAPAKSLRLTKEVLDERHRLQILIESLHFHVKSGVNQLHMIRQELIMMQSIESQLDANKNFKQRIQVPKTRKVPITKPNHYVTNCLVCTTTCHLNCSFVKDEDKYRCSAMNKIGFDATCLQCPNHCHWSEHYNRLYYYEEYMEYEERTLEDLKKKYDKAANDRISAVNILHGILCEYNAVQEKLMTDVQRICDCLQRLGEIAMRPDPLTTVEYIDVLIRGNEFERKVGWEDREIQLYNAKQRAELILKMRTDGSEFNPFQDLQKEVLLCYSSSTAPEKQNIFRRLITAFGAGFSVDDIPMFD